MTEIQRYFLNGMCNVSRSEVEFCNIPKIIKSRSNSIEFARMWDRCDHIYNDKSHDRDYKDGFIVFNQRNAIQSESVFVRAPMLAHIVLDFDGKEVRISAVHRVNDIEDNQEFDNALFFPYVLFELDYRKQLKSIRLAFRDEVIDDIVLNTSLNAYIK